MRRQQMRTADSRIHLDQDLVVLLGDALASDGGTQLHHLVAETAHPLHRCALANAWVLAPQDVDTSGTGRAFSGEHRSPKVGKVALQGVQALQIDFVLDGGVGHAVVDGLHLVDALTHTTAEGGST